MTVSNLVLKKFISPGKNIFNYDQIYGFITLDSNTKIGIQNNFVLAWHSRHSDPASFQIQLGKYS